MAEYIDREKLLDELGESASYHAESGREYQLLLRDRNIVREQPTADVIERSRIVNEFEAMINELMEHELEDTCAIGTGCVIKIIGKYKRKFKE